MQRILGRLPQGTRRGGIDADGGLQRRRAVDRQERPLGQRSRSSPAMHRARRRSVRDTFSCIATNGLSAATGLRSSRTCSAIAATGAIIGFALENSLVLQPQRMQLLHPFRQRRAHERANDRLRERAVEGEIDLGNAGGGREPALVGRIVAAERSDVVERPRLAPHHPIAGREIGVGRVLGLGFEHRLVEAGRQGVDQVDIARELAVLLSCNARRKRRFPDGRRSRGWCRRSSGHRIGSRRRSRRDRESIRAPAAAA